MIVALRRMIAGYGFLRFRRSAAEVEDDYVSFCKCAQPMRVMLYYVLVTTCVSIVMRFFMPVVHVRQFEMIDIYLMFFIPAIIVWWRGRSLARSLFLGRLALRDVLLVGIAVAIVSTLFFIFGGAFYGLYWEFRWRHFFQDGKIVDMIAYYIGPIGEETLFQVGVQTWLQRFGPIVAVVVTTLPFWAFHLYGGYISLKGALIYLLPGILSFAIVRQTPKSTGAAFVAHSVSNMISAVFAVSR